MEIKEGDYLICFTDHNDVGGMRFVQNYFIVGKKYKVYKSPIIFKDITELVVRNEKGWDTPIGDFIKTYLETEQEHREKKLSSLLEK